MEILTQAWSCLTVTIQVTSHLKHKTPNRLSTPCLCRGSRLIKVLEPSPQLIIHWCPDWPASSRQESGLGWKPSATLSEAVSHAMTRLGNNAQTLEWKHYSGDLLPRIRNIFVCLKSVARIAMCFFFFSEISHFLPQTLLQNMTCSFLDSSISRVKSILESFARSEQPVYIAQPIYCSSRLYLPSDLHSEPVV